MNDSTKIRTGRHVVFNMHVHLVFVTKYKNAVFTKSMLEYLKAIFTSVCHDFEVILTEFDGENDHVHLLIHYPPKVQLSKLVNSLKGVSSRMLRAKFEKQVSKLFWKGVLWSPSYFAASCGGAPIEMVKKYIQNQKSPTQ
jgi:putative transposase